MITTSKPFRPTAWNPAPRDWAEEWAYNVAMEIRRLRGKTSVRALAERTKELGHEVSRAVISDLEVGRRRHISVGEITVLAMALDTTPVALLYPDPVNGDTALLPGVEAGQRFAMQWFCGLVDADSAAGQELYSDPRAYAENLRRVEIAREIWELDDQRAALMQDSARAERSQKADYLRAMSDLARRIAKLKKQGN